MFREKYNWIDLSLYILLSIAVLYLTVFFFWGVGNKTLDLYAFRQAQTAISSYWMLKGGPWLAYETPVLGAPWAIPFEFPTYQLLVAAIAHLGVPLNVAGRSVSFLFFVGLVFPTYFIFKNLKINRRSYLVFLIILSASPLYVFWARSFMIETTALFFSACWLAMLMRLEHRTTVLNIFICLVFGTLAMLTKSTTFIVWGVAGALWVISYLCKQSTAVKTIKSGIKFAICGFVPLGLGYIWVVYSDHIKSLNAIGAHLTSEQLSTWNFGTLAQRLGEDLWLTVFVKRMLPDVFGYIGILVLIFMLLMVFKSKRKKAAIVSFVVFISSFMIFTNLYFVHHYYLAASGIFLIMAASIIIGDVFRGRYKILGLFLVSGILVSQIWFTNNTYANIARHDGVNKPEYQAGLLANEITSPDEVVVVFGLDWSSEVLYYAKRKGMAVPGWLPPEKLNKILQQPSGVFDGAAIGAFLDCRRNPEEQVLSQETEGWLKSRTLVEEVGFCKVYK